jgi:uncharacterized membrane protein YhaH (DUF805 family)
VLFATIARELIAFPATLLSRDISEGDTLKITIVLIAKLVYFAMSIPIFTAMVRRLHDIDKGKKSLVLPLVLATASFILLWAGFFITMSGITGIILFFGYSALMVGALGQIYFLIGAMIWLCRKGTVGDNRFGSDPLQSKN